MKEYLKPADILLPKRDFTEWSVIACDQYTSQPEYWEKTETIVGDKPSSLKIILPEVYLEEDNSSRISEINGTMQKYLNSDIFDCFKNTCVYIERTLSDSRVRRGILGLIDLEDYSYEKGSKTAIRATEETVLERIPARVEIRKGAPMEIPHIMLLIDDHDKTVIEPLGKIKDSFDVLYDFPLMQNAGSVKGYAVGKPVLKDIQNALEKLKDASEDGFLFAMGDGNHSLAAAKECYKQGAGPRYALAEVVNIHDASLEFEPIYRVVFGADCEKLINDFIESSGGEYEGSDAQEFTCIYGNIERKIYVKPTGKLCVATLQKFLDEYIKKNDKIKIDYIHGENSVYELSKKADTLGFIFSGMEKSELFPAIIADGSLPRKTFSMGHADDKRFYLEARKIV